LRGEPRRAGDVKLSPSLARAEMPRRGGRGALTPVEVDMDGSVRPLQRRLED